MGSMAGANEEQRSDYAQDGSVDLRGNPVLRSKRGGWKACSFVVGKSIFSSSPPSHHLKLILHSKRLKNGSLICLLTHN